MKFHLRRHSRLFLLPVFLGVFLTACNLTTKTEAADPIFKPESINNKNQAGLYIYRPPAMANGLYSTPISIDDSQHFKVNSGQLKYLRLAVGQHRIMLNVTDAFKGKHVAKLAMQAGKNYFLRISTSLNLVTTGAYRPYGRTFDLQIVNENRATQQINKCCFSVKHLTPKTTIINKSGAKPPLNGSGFSVDKTDDPFSHK